MSNTWKEIAAEIWAAKHCWEKAGGTIDQHTEYHRRWADKLAADVGIRIEWHSIHPSIHWPDGTEQTWAEFNRSVSGIRGDNQ